MHLQEKIFISIHQMAVQTIELLDTRSNRLSGRLCRLKTSVYWGLLKYVYTRTTRAHVRNEIRVFTYYAANVLRKTSVWRAWRRSAHKNWQAKIKSPGSSVQNSWTQQNHSSQPNDMTFHRFESNWAELQCTKIFNKSLYKYWRYW